MSTLTGRRVVLGVCGGIAAYKAVEVCRRMVDAGAHVVPVMTSGDSHFIGETTLSALASEPVRRTLWDESDPIPHTRLGQGADLVVVAPATARLLSAYAHGYSHDLLTNVLIATRAPVLVCPAMHTEMWEHPSVRDNMALLVSRGTHVVGPASGRLAGGDVGAGRLADPEEIVAAAEAVLAGVGDGSPSRRRDLDGVRVLVTAGGTREPIDPVRFIGNRSSGRMGIALAIAAAARGAEVTLIAANVTLPVPPGIERVEVTSAAELATAAGSAFENCDVLLMAAAVADFRPTGAAGDKLAREGSGGLELHLEETEDVLAGLGVRRRPGQVLVGFAAEHGGDFVGRARGKLERKGIDAIVVNDVSDAAIGFESEENEVTIVEREGELLVPRADKAVVAEAILDRVEALRS